MVSKRNIAEAVGVSVATVSTVLANASAALGILEEHQ
jgi:DNA-binding LacI/PurR family transcriptional regulator